ncbi:hypothetical protein PAMA_017278 [Pampus argenteus]
MAAPRDNLLSLGHLTSTDRDTFDTFTNRKEQILKKSRVTHLQQRWQELKDRERAAQQHNRQLLQQFEEAQDTLREMMARTAAMKTIRKGYERYLEENSPRWQQQLKEKTQAAQRKRMEEYLKMCLKNTEEEQVRKSPVDQPLHPQGRTKKPQKVTAPQENYSQNSHMDYNQDEILQSSWLTRPHPQTVRFPLRVPYQPQVSSQAPTYFLPHPHPFQFQHLASSPRHHHPWARQNPPNWASTQPDHSWSCEALWGQLYMDDPPSEREVVPVVAEEAETSRAPSSKTERGGGSRSHLSQELDIKPVRLSSGHTESSESGRDSCQTSREKKKKREKRGRAQHSSSESERCSSQESSRTSSVIVSVAAAQPSESEASSEKGSTSSKKTRRSVEEVAAKERTRSKGESHDEKSQCTDEESGSENVGNQSPVEKSESCRDKGSGSVSMRLENGDADEIEQQESSSSEQSSAGEKVVERKGHEKEQGDREDDDEGGEENEPNSQTDEEQEDRDVEDDEEVSARKNTIEEEETGAQDEEQGDDEVQSDRPKNEDSEIRKQASSQDEEDDEDESAGSEDKIEDDDEGSDEEEDEEQRSDMARQPEEERDSEDSIISPHENRPKKIHVIPEESSEDDDGKSGNKTESDDSNEIGDEDIEHLLAPQTQTKEKELRDLKTDDKPKAICEVEIFQVETSTDHQTDHQSDSDEFDHFYD